METGNVIESVEFFMGSFFFKLKFHFAFIFELMESINGRTFCWFREKIHSFKNRTAV